MARGPSTRVVSLLAVGWLFAPAIPAMAQAPAAVTRLPRGAILQQLSGEFEALAESVHPAVVQVIGTGLAPAAPVDSATGGSILQRQRTGGTGVVLDAAGYIVTNAHVVEGARFVRVILPTPAPRAGASIVRPTGPSLEARLVGLDRATDLAVLKVEAEKLPALPLADSDLLRPGQIVLAFGSPLALESSVTMGIVSAVGRQREPEDPMVYVQTDAPINPGNSGGPLVDLAGRVVGINTFILSRSGGSEGVGFAIPSNIVANIFQQLKTSGRVRRGTLGVVAQTVTPTVAAGLGLPIAGGALLGDVIPGSPAEEAGLQPGDVVLTLDGKRMENGRQLEVNVYQRRIGDTVTLDVLRGGLRTRAIVRVVELEEEGTRFADLVDPEKNLVPRLGVLVIAISPQVSALLPPLRRPAGLLVAARASDSPTTSGQALLAGDIITAVNGVAVTDLDGLRAQLARTPAHGACVLHVQRGSTLRFIALDLD